MKNILVLLGVLTLLGTCAFAQGNGQSAVPAQEQAQPADKMQGFVLESAAFEGGKRTLEYSVETDKSVSYTVSLDQGAGADVWAYMTSSCAGANLCEKSATELVYVKKMAGGSSYPVVWAFRESKGNKAKGVLSVFLMKVFAKDQVLTEQDLRAQLETVKNFPISSQSEFLKIFKEKPVKKAKAPAAPKA